MKSWKKDLSSSLKKEFSKETKIVKKIKAFIRSKVHVEKTKYVWKKQSKCGKSKVCVEEHTGKLRGRGLGCLNRASFLDFFSGQSSSDLILVWAHISQPRRIPAGIFSLLFSFP